MKHIAVLFAFLISALTTMATETRPVAVLNIRSADLDSNQLRTLTGALISELRPLILPRKMMSWEEIKSIMSHAVMKNMMGCDETQCLMDLAGELDASAIVSGDISKISDKLFVLNIKMVSVEKPDEANSAYVKATNIEELFDKFPEVAKKLVGTPAAPAAAAVKSPEPVTLTASLASAAVSAPAASRAPVAEQKREATPRKRVLQPVASVKAPEQKKEIPAPAESAVSSPEKKPLGFITKFGLEFSGRNVNVRNDVADGAVAYVSGDLNTTSSVGSLDLRLCARFFRIIYFESGIFFQTIDDIGLKTSQVTYRRVSLPSQVYPDGEILFTVSDNGVGSTSSLGLAFDLGKRWSLATGCTFRTLNYEAQGQLNLPNIGAPVPTVYGDSKHMMVMACPHLRVEFFLKPKFSIMLGGGASFAERFVEYSPGYRSWASQWVVSQPAERELFSLSGPEVSLGLRWYWR